MYADFQKDAVEVRSGLRGLFGCNINKGEYQKTHLATIFPGSSNMWVIGKRRGASGDIHNVVEKWLDPVDTGFWATNAPYGVVPIQSTDHMRQLLVASERPIEQKNPKVENLGNTIDFYLLVFNAPGDAPVQIPWPLIGCPEEADWTVTYVMGPEGQITQPPVTSDPLPSESEEAAEKRKQEAIKAIEEASSFPGSESEFSQGVHWGWYVATAAILGGAGYAVWRTQQPRQRRA